MVCVSLVPQGFAAEVLRLVVGTSTQIAALSILVGFRLNVGTECYKF